MAASLLTDLTIKLRGLKGYNTLWFSKSEEKDLRARESAVSGDGLGLGSGLQRLPSQHRVEDEDKRSECDSKNWCLLDKASRPFAHPALRLRCRALSRCALAMRRVSSSLSLHSRIMLRKTEEWIALGSVSRRWSTSRLRTVRACSSRCTSTARRTRSTRACPSFPSSIRLR